MSADRLKHSEIFSFLAIVFFILYIVSGEIKDRESRSAIAAQKSLVKKIEQLEIETQQKLDRIRGQHGKKLEEKERKYQEIIDGLERELEKEKIENKIVNEELKRLAKGKDPNYLDPIVIDRAAGKYHFKTGDATILRDLKRHIQQKVVPEIEKRFEKYNIDTIEVIGHTDGQEILRTSNIDRYINGVALGKQQMNKLKAGSNADLGLMRALAVVRELKRIKQEGKGLQVLDRRGLQEEKIFRAYSAAQLIDTNGEFADRNVSNNSKRRRIEIRFTKLNKN